MWSREEEMQREERKGRVSENGSEKEGAEGSVQEEEEGEEGKGKREKEWKERKGWVRGGREEKSESVWEREIKVKST